MNYDRERAGYEQSCTEDMIRMREPLRHSTGHHPDPLLDKIALAIWTADGAVPRILTEICRPDSDLHRQQSLCMRRARAVLAALAS